MPATLLAGLLYLAESSVFLRRKAQPHLCRRRTRCEGTLLKLLGTPFMSSQRTASKSHLELPDACNCITPLLCRSTQAPPPRLAQRPVTLSVDAIRHARRRDLIISARGGLIRNIGACALTIHYPQNGRTTHQQCTRNQRIPCRCAKL